jgi:hypothetical protein
LHAQAGYVQEHLKLAWLEVAQHLVGAVLDYYIDAITTSVSDYLRKEADYA